MEANPFLQSEAGKSHELSTWEGVQRERLGDPKFTDAEQALTTTETSTHRAAGNITAFEFLASWIRARFADSERG